MQRTIVLLFLTVTSITSHAVLVDPWLRVQIKDACLTHENRSTAGAYCACVATRHFRSAKQMPDYRRATRDLKWVLNYYRAHDRQTLARLRANPDNLIEYDAIIGKECRKGEKS